MMMKKKYKYICKTVVLAFVSSVFSAAVLAEDAAFDVTEKERADAAAAEKMTTIEPVEGRWSEEKINAWYAEQPWLVGCNYYPATAINQIEMWQASTWDPKQIDKELGWAAGMGMNTLRVYLHDLVWVDDETGLYERMDAFLDICKKHGIRPWFVFFDDCHYSNAKLGPQPLPVRAWHNSGWKQCPDRDLAVRFAKGKATPEEVAQLKGYIQQTMRHFANDDRVLAWELYNEPGRGGFVDFDNNRKWTDMGDMSAKLIQKTWEWAREINPSQPITSTTMGSVGKLNIAINRANADFFSIHNYSDANSLEGLIKSYKKNNRPIIVSEWLARTNGSRVETCLPVMKKHNVGAVNWGFVVGKSQTHYPWGSRSRGNVDKLREKGDVVNPGEPYPEPEVWFHDIYRMDGTPFDEKEIELFRELTGTNK